MSAATQTRIFGIRLGIDPKILIGVLVAIAGLLYWYNTRSDDEASAPATTHTESAAAPVAAPRHVQPARNSVANDRGTLRVRAVDATRGDVDPTLRLDLLARLHSVEPFTSGRSLFESGPGAQAASLTKIPGPTIVPKPLPAGLQASTPTAAPAFTIPLKYYGFVKPTAKGESSRGFFLDGDDVLVASEGELLKQRYLVVSLTPTSVRLEDVQLKQGQTLQVVPEAAP